MNNSNKLKEGDFIHFCIGQTEINGKILSVVDGKITAKSILVNFVSI